MRVGSPVSSRWTKLKRASVAELGDRARQWLAVWSERAKLSDQIRLPSDRQLGSACLADFQTRTKPAFFAAFNEQADLLAVLRGRWPDLEASVRESANRICAGQFDFLG